VSEPPARVPDGVATVSGKAAQLRRLELEVTIRLDGLLRGEFLGLRPGPGSETAGTRAYEVGDDARRIDWNVSARSLTTQVRTTEADRELNTWLVVDRSPSMDFGTTLCEKRDLAFSSAAAFGFLTARHGNRLGVLVAGGDRVTRIGPSSAARSSLMACLSQLYDATRESGADPKARTVVRRRTGAGGPEVAAASRTEPLTSATRVADALGELERSRARRGQVVVISDFFDTDDWAAALRRVALRHQVVAVQVVDPRELLLPAIGITAFVDPETGRRLHVQTNSGALRERYEVAARERHESIGRAIRGAGAEHLVLATDRDWLLEIVRFVAGRRSLRGRRASAPVDRPAPPRPAVVATERSNP
jgi:uncharacterized protein (DUF58 family)